MKNFANASQEVLAFAYVPAEAIISICPWQKIRKFLPFWLRDLVRKPSVPFREQFEIFKNAAKSQQQFDLGGIISDTIPLVKAMTDDDPMDGRKLSNYRTELVFNLIFIIPPRSFPNYSFSDSQGHGAQQNRKMVSRCLFLSITSFNRHRGCWREKIQIWFQKNRGILE